MKCSRDKGLPFRPLSVEAEAILAAHDWKTDLSALETTIRRAVIMADDHEIGADLIRLPDAQSDDDGENEGTKLPEGALRALLGYTLTDVERELILMTLEYCSGNRTHTADILGISIRTLRNKLQRYSLTETATSTQPSVPGPACSPDDSRPGRHRKKP